MATDACTSIDTDSGFPGTDLYCDEGLGRCRQFLEIVCSNPGGGGVCFTPLAEGEDCSVEPNRCGLFLTCDGATCEYGDYTGMCPAP